MEPDYTLEQYETQAKILYQAIHDEDENLGRLLDVQADARAAHARTILMRRDSFEKRLGQITTRIWNMTREA